MEGESSPLQRDCQMADKCHASLCEKTLYGIPQQPCMEHPIPRLVETVKDESIQTEPTNMVVISLSLYIYASKLQLERLFPVMLIK